jgi:transcriptional regulator with XRE-family HTH domain
VVDVNNIPEDDAVVGLILDLVEARKRSGMSQRDVAAKIEVSHQALQAWESFRRPPSSHNLARWGRVFGKELGWRW